MAKEWIAEVRELYESAFSIDWEAHLRRVNRSLGLEADSELQTSFRRLPPVWFQGDLDALSRRDWTLVISLNHQLSGKQPTPDRQAFWDYCRNHSRNHWYPRFFRPLVRLAATALGGTSLDEREYATTRMVFTELVPYASRRFELRTDQIAPLTLDDPGCAIANGVIQALLGAEPRLILINGLAAIADFEAIYGQRLRGMTWHSYASEGRDPRKALRHAEGWLQSPFAECPVIGFPFLRTPKTHNSNAEIDQLARLIGDFLRKGRSTP